jgi:cob(I)alamin adenosyltransferase
MSIVTKTGDTGTTGLMYNRRVSKTHPRVEAYGCLDELTSCLGMARAQTTDGEIQATLLGIQKDLITVMGELATDCQDRDRYLSDGFTPVNAAMTERLDQWIQSHEPKVGPFRGWCLPGDTLAGAALEVARTVCRRSERKVVALQENGIHNNREVVVYLNRLADALWLMARWVDKQTVAKPSQ